MCLKLLNDILLPYNSVGWCCLRPAWKFHNLPSCSPAKSIRSRTGAHKWLHAIVWVSWLCANKWPHNLGQCELLHVTVCKSDCLLFAGTQKQTLVLSQRRDYGGAQAERDNKTATKKKRESEWGARADSKPDWAYRKKSGPVGCSQLR